MTKRTVWRVRLDSRHFEFEAFGETESEAKSAFATGLMSHLKQTNADPAWIAESLAQTPAEEMELGVCYRDGEAL